MFLSYPNKKTELEIYQKIPKSELVKQNNSSSENKLIFGENLMVLKNLLEKQKMAGKIDLIYIDPPFATKNVFTFSEERTSTISMEKRGKVAYSDKLHGADFLEFLRERLFLLKSLLSSNGSIYLHTDYKIGHYVKIVMDEVFGIENFRNDITREKCNPKNFARKGFGNIKDCILFYSKTKSPIWNEPKDSYTEEDKLKLFPKTDGEGRRYTTIPLHAPGETQNGNTSRSFKGVLPPKGRHWRTDITTLESWDSEGIIEWSQKGNPRKKIYLDEQEGKRVQDIWRMKDPQYPQYPTEKNAALLDLIVKTSSAPDSYVLDCFCGSGTTLKAAQILGRKWIGIDQSEQAIKMTIKKLNNLSSDIFTSEVTYEQFICEALI